MFGLDAKLGREVEEDALGLVTGRRTDPGGDVAVRPEMPGVGTEVARDETDGQGFGHGYGDGLWSSGRSIRRHRIDVTFGARRPRSRTGGLAGSGVALGGRLERKRRRAGDRLRRADRRPQQADHGRSPLRRSAKGFSSAVAKRRLSQQSKLT